MSFSGKISSCLLQAACLFYFFCLPHKVFGQNPEPVFRMATAPDTILTLLLLMLFYGVAYAFYKLRKARKDLAIQHALVEQQARELLRMDAEKSRFVPSESEHFSAACAGTILIAEDNEDLYRYMSDILMDRYQILHAPNGLAALDILEEQRTAQVKTPVDLIVTDVMMPEKDGIWLLNRIKTDPDFFHLPVVVITALTEDPGIRQMLRIGIDDYLSKPFGEEELRLRVDHLIQNYKARTAPDAAEDPDETDMNPGSVSDWLVRLEHLVQIQLHEHDFNIDSLSDQMGLSSRQLLRRLKQYTGNTISQFIQELRMQKAKHLLESQPRPTIKEVASAVGLRDQKYFSKEFQKRYGVLPSDYAGEKVDQK
jgi:CheY-like chemotaxis protein/cbb3-type cytochrome oxidase subunit 3